MNIPAHFRKPSKYGVILGIIIAGISSCQLLMGVSGLFWWVMGIVGVGVITEEIIKMRIEQNKVGQ